MTRNLNSLNLKPVDIETIFLNRLASVGQKSLADFLQLNESTISRWKSDGYFKQIADILVFFDIRIAPENGVLVSEDYLKSVEILADIGLQAMRNRE